MKLVYSVTPKQRLIIVEHALKQMKAFAQHRSVDREAGGVLLGRHLLDSRDVVVDEVSTPQSLSSLSYSARTSSRLCISISLPC